MVHYLEILNTCHDEWVSIVRSFGGGIYSEDIVQETYLRIDKAGSKNKLVVGGEINRGFMWITLRNNYINFAKQKAKVQKIELKDYHMKNIIQHEKTKYIANDILEQKIHEEVSKWHWYDKEMFLLITSGKVSMRKVSRDSKISLSSIANTMNKCKKRLKIAIGEDYEDYVNGDYKKIK